MGLALFMEWTFSSNIHSYISEDMHSFLIDQLITGCWCIIGGETDRFSQKQESVQHNHCLNARGHSCPHLHMCECVCGVCGVGAGRQAGTECMGEWSVNLN